MGYVAMNKISVVKRTLFISILIFFKNISVDVVSSVLQSRLDHLRWCIYIVSD